MTSVVAYYDVVSDDELIVIAALLQRVAPVYH